ncbi:MAG: glycosyltransferase family 39 protein, partial [Candidatus Eremiobacteraeota bacterium]|nr:glycosyltransferase family 39 protein [Candidatus Eremiobacteraeota bacterium]
MTNSVRSLGESSVAIPRPPRPVDVFGLLAVVAVFCAVVEWLAAKLNLYIDELYSLHSTAFGIKEAIAQARGFEQQPPLYFVALAAWRHVNGGDVFARQFSIACSVATLVLVWAFARRFVPTLPAWLVALVFAVNPVFIWATLDIRVYALVMLLSAALTILFFHAFFGASMPPARVAAFTIVETLGIYTQYFVGALLLGFAVALIFSDRRRRILPYALAMLVVIAFASPLFIADLSHQLRQATDVTIVPPKVVAERMLGSMLGFVLPHYWTSGVSRLALIAYAAISIAIIVGAVRLVRPGREQGALALVVLTSTLFFMAVILVLKVPLEMPRHIAVLFVPLLFLTTALFAKPEGLGVRRLAVAYAVISVIFSLATDAKSYKPPFTKVGDWARVGAYLTDHVDPSESIAVFDTEDVLG